MTAVPVPTAVTVNAALDAPAGTVIVVCTVATAGLLDVSVMVAAADVGAASVTVPWPLLLTAMVDTFSATADTAGVVLADVDDEPQRMAATAANSISASVTNGIAPRRLTHEGRFLSDTAEGVSWSSFMIPQVSTMVPRAPHKESGREFRGSRLRNAWTTSRRVLELAEFEERVH